MQHDAFHRDDVSRDLWLLHQPSHPVTFPVRSLDGLAVRSAAHIPCLPRVLRLDGEGVCNQLGCDVWMTHSKRDGEFIVTHERRRGGKRAKRRATVAEAAPGAARREPE